MKELTVLEPKLKWYHFRQNNSGGYFIENEIVGEDVFIQAHSAKEAVHIADKLFEGYSEYCDCCGERWYTWLDEDDGYDVPTKYRTPISEGYETFGKGGYAVLHWYNGLVDKVKGVGKY